VLLAIPQGALSAPTSPGLATSGWHAWSAVTATGCASYVDTAPSLNSSAGTITYSNRATSSPCGPGPVRNESEAYAFSGFVLDVTLPTLSGTHTIFENLTLDFISRVSAENGTCTTLTPTNFSCGTTAVTLVYVLEWLFDLSAGRHGKYISAERYFLSVRSVENYSSCWGGYCSNVSGILNAGPVHVFDTFRTSFKSSFRSSDSYAVLVEFAPQVGATMGATNAALHGGVSASASLTPGPSGNAILIAPPGVV